MLHRCELCFHPLLKLETEGISVNFLLQNTRGFPKSPLCSNAFVTMIYLGKSKNVCLSYYKEEIKVYQQHCGSENICVYKGKLLEGGKDRVREFLLILATSFLAKTLP